MHRPFFHLIFSVVKLVLTRVQLSDNQLIDHCHLVTGEIPTNLQNISQEISSAKERSPDGLTCSCSSISCVPFGEFL